MSGVAPQSVLRFGECEVDPRLREVRLRGQRQPVAPKVFDLLLTLVQQRHRAISKAELVAALWQREEVSETVLARTLMQARKLIGDAADQQLWIKTIHGYGYRFVGEVFEAGADSVCAPTPDSSISPSPALRAGRLRLGVLPCENQTGDSAIEWTRFGLMALVSHALESDARLDVVPMQTMFEALARLPSNALTHEKAQLVLQALGLDWVIQATIRRQGTALWLDYQRVGIDGRSQSGSLRETDPVVMGQRFAQAVSAGLFPGQGVVLEFLSRDPFVNQAFARAIELWSQQQLQSAATLHISLA